jgi:ankyrin repeat protein
MTALITAAAENHSDVIRSLIKAGAALNKQEEVREAQCSVLTTLYDLCLQFATGRLDGPPGCNNAQPDRRSPYSVGGRREP